MRAGRLQVLVSRQPESQPVAATRFLLAYCAPPLLSHDYSHPRHPATEVGTRHRSLFLRVWNVDDDCPGFLRLIQHTCLAGQNGSANDRQAAEHCHALADTAAAS